MRLQLHPGQGVHLHLGRLTAQHARGLGLLEVGGDVEAVHRHDGQKARARLHEVPDVGLPVADHACDRRADVGVRLVLQGEVEGGRGLLAPGAGLGERRHEFAAAVAGHGLLAAADRQGRAAAFGRRAGGGRVGVDAFGVAARHETGAHQRGIALAVGLGADGLGVAGADAGLGLANRSGGQGRLGVQMRQGRLRLADRGVGDGEVPTRRGDPGGIFLGVQADQHLPGLDRLVLRHQHLGDVAADAGREDGGIGLQIGVVGADRALGGAQVEHARPADDQGRAEHQPAARRQPAALQGNGAHAGDGFHFHWSNTSRVEVAVA